MEIKNIVIYPNPFSANQGDLRINFDITRQADSVTVRIYTKAFRKVVQETEKRAFFRDSVFILRQKSAGKLANGVYYVSVSGENASEKAVSRIEELVVLR
jgi:hypothetical protein